MSSSDDGPNDEQVPLAKCCGDHELEFGAGKSCKDLNWRCILRKVIDRWLES